MASDTSCEFDIFPSYSPSDSAIYPSTSSEEEGGKKGRSRRWKKGKIGFVFAMFCSTKERENLTKCFAKMSNQLS